MVVVFPGWLFTVLPYFDLVVKVDSFLIFFFFWLLVRYFSMFQFYGVCLMLTNLDGFWENYDSFKHGWSRISGSCFQTGKGGESISFCPYPLYSHSSCYVCSWEWIVLCIEEIFVFKRFIFLSFSFPGVTMSGTQPFLQQTHPGW